jgi:hypothetical protein
MFKCKELNPSKEIAEKLTRHGEFKSHGRHISLQAARELGLVVDALEDDHSLQELVLSVFHATMHTFGATGAVKIIENHLGRAFVKAEQKILLQRPPGTNPAFVQPQMGLTKSP